MLESKEITFFVKYDYFHKEQKKKMKDNPFLVKNLFYNIQQDFYVCPIGQRMENVGSGKRTSANGYESKVSYYQAKGNRTIEINHSMK